MFSYIKNVNKIPSPEKLKGYLFNLLVKKTRININEMNNKSALTMILNELVNNCFNLAKNTSKDTEKDHSLFLHIKKDEINNKIKVYIGCNVLEYPKKLDDRLNVPLEELEKPEVMFGFYDSNSKTGGGGLGIIHSRLFLSEITNSEQDLEFKKLKVKTPVGKNAECKEEEIFHSFVFSLPVFDRKPSALQIIKDEKQKVKQGYDGIAS